MIKCYFIEIISIESSQPKSNFQESEIEKLADSILETDALIRPLILQDIGNERYTVIEGHLEYYAAVRAREKNPLKAEEVNAFVIPTKSQVSAIKQLSICDNNFLLRSKNLPGKVTATSSTGNELIAGNLVSEMSAVIVLQIKPILDKLAKQEKVLEVLESKASEQVTSSALQHQLQSILVQLAEHKLILDTLKPIKAVKTPNTVKAPIISKKLLDFREWCEQRQDLTQLNSTLSLINTLNREQLILKMKQSKIYKAEKLAINIIDKRDTQIERRFDSWETILTKGIGGLGDATIKNIIDKLR